MSSTMTTSSTAMAPAGQSDETIPLGVFLVKSDCNGEKLLFRFPYTTVKSELGSGSGSGSKSHNASGGTNSSKPSKYALLMPPKSGGAAGGGGALRGGGAGGPEMDAEHGHLPTAGIDDPQTGGGGAGGPGGAALLPSFAELISSSNLLTLDANDQDEISKVIGITDSTFSTLFGVLKSKLCGMKFELKVDNVRFVGHPSTLTAFGATEESAVLDVCFHVVFALKANAPADVVHCYHDLSKRIATALISEEARCGYFSKETKIMGRCHDEIATTLAIADRDGIAAPKVLAEGNDPSLAGDASLPALPYSSILERSHLAKSLQTVFRQLLNDGLVQVRINSLVNIHFCLPQKVHRKLLMAPTVMTPLTPSSSSSSSSSAPSASITTTTSKLPLITPESINKCLCGLRPYHTFLLLVSTAELMDFLPPDVSSPVVCLVKMASPLKNLIELSADAGISLSQTFNVVAQLVYWGKATIIFPICETNLYVLHPNANTDLHSPLAAQFEARFGKANAQANTSAANTSTIANNAEANANTVPTDSVPVNTSSDPLLPNGPANDISDRPSLHYLLSAFSPGVSLSQLRSPMDTAEQAREWVQVLEWLLQKRLLMQLHTYVVFFPLGQGPKPYIHCNVSNNGSHHHHQQHPRRMSFTQVSTSRPPSSSTTGGGGDLAGDYCSTIASSSYHSESSLLGGSLSPSADQLFDYFGSNQSTVTAGSSASMFRAGGGGRVHTTSMSETGGVGGGGSLNGFSKTNGGGGSGGTELSQLESAEMILRESDLLLSPKEMTAVLAVCATKSFEDIRLFARLCPVYFDGHHHVEDMMHYENLRRSQILTLVEKFQELLLVYTYEDTTVDTLQPYNTL